MNQIILRERVITIAPGDVFDQALQGNVLRVTSGLVPLRVQSRDGQLDFTLQSGERAEFPDQNSGLMLSHASGVVQSFTVQVGQGVNVASALVSGTVTITGTPTVINGGGTLTSIQNTVKVLSDGYTFGQTWQTNNNSTANVAELIIAPAANVNGILVHKIHSLSQVVGVAGAFVAKASVPASVIDGLVIGGVVNYGVYAGADRCVIGLMQRVIVPAGRGLYFYPPTGESNVQRTIEYTLL